MNSTSQKEPPLVTTEAEDLQKVERCPHCGEPVIHVPALTCGRCKQAHALRCTTYRREGLFIAECIDLDLLSQGETEEEAIGKLQEAMFSYLEVACDGDMKGLVLRPSPFSHRLRYQLLRFIPARLALLLGKGSHFLLKTSDLGNQHFSHC